jgi:hypothetical protein
MITVMVNFLVGLAILLIGISLVQDSRKKRIRTRRIELISGIIAIAAGAFIAAMVAGASILKFIDRTNKGGRVKNLQSAPAIPVETAMQKRIKYLQKYVPPDLLANADPRFLTYAGTASSPRLPLVFPYEIRLNPDDATGILGSHTGEAPVDDPRSIKPLLDGLEQTNFNNRCLVAKITANQNEENEKIYILFIFSTGVITRYSTEEQMWQAANDAGFNGGEVMYSPEKLREDYFQDAAEAF